MAEIMPCQASVKPRQERSGRVRAMAAVALALGASIAWGCRTSSPAQDAASSRCIWVLLVSQATGSCLTFTAVASGEPLPGGHARAGPPAPASPSWSASRVLPRARRRRDERRGAGVGDRGARAGDRRRRRRPGADRRSRRSASRSRSAAPRWPRPSRAAARPPASAWRSSPRSASACSSSAWTWRPTTARCGPCRSTASPRSPSSSSRSWRCARRRSSAPRFAPLAAVGGLDIAANAMFAIALTLGMAAHRLRARLALPARHGRPRRPCASAGRRSVPACSSASAASRASRYRAGLARVGSAACSSTSRSRCGPTRCATACASGSCSGSRSSSRRRRCATASRGSSATGRTSTSSRGRPGDPGEGHAAIVARGRRGGCSRAGGAGFDPQPGSNAWDAPRWFVARPRRAPRRVMSARRRRHEPDQQPPALPPRARPSPSSRRRARRRRGRTSSRRPRTWRAAATRSCFGPNHRKVHGYLAGTDEERAADIQWALSEPGIDMVLCARRRLRREPAVQARSTGTGSATRGSSAATATSPRCTSRSPSTAAGRRSTARRSCASRARRTS